MCSSVPGMRASPPNGISANEESAANIEMNGAVR